MNLRLMLRMSVPQRSWQIFFSGISVLKISRIFAPSAENSGDRAHLCSHFSRWFNGFKTFKLIRHLTDNSLPPLDMFAALRQLMEMMGKELPIEVKPGSVPPLQDRMEILDFLRKIDR